MKNKFFRKVLSNGMTVILEKRDLPVVSVAFAVRAGGINEELSEKGISHFIEHMLYKGTKNRSAKKIAEEIERNGGNMNGFTAEEIVAYWVKMPSQHLEIALNVLADMIKNPLFDKKELNKERKVIFEELKMRTDNPLLFVFYELQTLLYGGVLGTSCLQTKETLKTINKKKITKKFKEVYTPNNLILCAVGDADFNELVNFAGKNFGKEKELILEQNIELKNEIRIEERQGIDQANLVFAYHVPLASDNKSYAAMVLSELMGGGFTSRLYQEIREKRNLAYGVQGHSLINKRFAYNYLWVGTEKKNVELVKKLILKEFEKVAKNLKEKELVEIKKQMIGNHYISMEDSVNQMEGLLAEEIQGDASKFYDFEKNISGVRLKDVKILASKIKKDYSFFALVPKN